jgi:hypothetical protein
MILQPGCAAPEQALLDEFFGASRLRDRTALQRMSTTIFEPLEQGIVRTFQVTDVTAERLIGDVAAKDVTLDALVAAPDGRMVQKTLVVTLERKQGDDAGRWIVTAVKEGAAPGPPS